MTEFITRNYGNNAFEVIIKTESEDHYKEAQEFARRLIDHEKPVTNADRIRSMTDKELASFLADRFARRGGFAFGIKAQTMTATQIAEITHAWYVAWMQWLRLPAELMERASQITGIDIGPVNEEEISNTCNENGENGIYSLWTPPDVR